MIPLVTGRLRPTFGPLVGPPLLPALVAGALCLGACGGPATQAPRRTLRRPVPERVTAETYGTHLRRFQLLRPSDEDRAAHRARLVAHLHTLTGPILDRGDYDAVVAHLHAITRLYAPAEIEDGNLPVALEPLARWLIDRASPRGDEARALSAWLILAKLSPGQPEPRRYYERLHAWATDVERSVGPVGFDGDFVEVLQEHARLTPTPALLSRVARLHIDVRNTLMQQFRGPERMGALAGREYYELIQRKTFDVAGVFLRFGDTASALSHVQAIGAAGDLDGDLLHLLEQAREDGMEGADAILGLAHQPPYATGDLGVAFGLCSAGRAAYPSDSRFARCLAALATLSGDAAAVVEHYEEALAVASDRERIYDELLVRLTQLLDRMPPDGDIGAVRKLGSRLLATLAQRDQEFADSEPPVTAETINLALAQAEMNAGQPARAELHLKDSLKTEPSVDAHSQLGQLLLRLGRVQEAEAQYGAALQLLTGDDAVALNRRANLLERQGDAARMCGDADDAESRYRASLVLWDDLAHMLSGAELSLAHVRRGVLLSRLGETQYAASAFRRAADGAGGLAETYRGILAHLVVAEADRNLAHRIFRHALNQVQLDPEWKVYLALWLQIIDGMTEGDPDPEADAVLQDFAGDRAWWARLASFGAGRMGFQELAQHAQSVGQRAEAQFYAGARALTAGDLGTARVHFQAVLNTRMVNFYEYIMAQELMRRFPLPAAAPAPPAAGMSASRDGSPTSPPGAGHQTPSEPDGL